MIFLYCLTLLLLVYLAPALAIYPKIILSSRTVVAVPFLSVGIIAVLQLMMAATGLYNHMAVMSVSGVLLLIALARLAMMYRKRQMAFDWADTHRTMLLFCLILGIYWIVRLGSSGFDTDDEIYSWNMWAIQHYQGVPVDYYYTDAPYPQLFPILISYCYQLLGSVELQVPVKAMLAIFPVALWGCIAVAPKETTTSNAVRSVLAMLLLAVAIAPYFAVGLADPLMASALIVAIFLFMQYSEHPERRELLGLSLCCAAVACFAKQPALIWALFAFPAIVLFSVWKRHLPLLALAAAGALVAAALIWVLGPGSGFEHNRGVIIASQEGRGIAAQLLYAVKKFSVESPLIPVLLALCVTSLVRTRHHLGILFLFLLPAFLAWLLYGAYSLRLGIHVIALAVILIAATDFALPKWLGGGDLGLAETLVRRFGVVFAILLSLLVTTASLNQVNRSMKQYENDYSLYQGGKNILTKYFGMDAKYIFENLYDQPDLLLWVPSNYIYGIFYSHTPMIRPDKKKYDATILLDEIGAYKPDYLFDAGPQVDYGGTSAILKTLATQQCPFLFQQVRPRNKSGYTLYRLVKDEALIAQCRNTLRLAL